MSNSDVIKSGTIHGFQYEIFREQSPVNPLIDSDMLSVIEQVNPAQSKYNLGHESHSNLADLLEGPTTIEELEKLGWMIRKLQYTGEKLITTSSDSPMCYQYITPIAMASEKCSKESAIEIMNNELKVYNMWINNDVFGFCVCFEGQVIDSCGEYYEDRPESELEDSEIWADLAGAIDGAVKGQKLDRIDFQNKMVAWLGLETELLTNRLFLAGECFIMDRIVDDEIKATGFTYVDIKSMRSFSFSKYWETKEELENFLKKYQIYQKVF